MNGTFRASVTRQAILDRRHWPSSPPIFHSLFGLSGHVLPTLSPVHLPDNLHHSLRPLRSGLCSWDRSSGLQSVTSEGDNSICGSSRNKSDLGLGNLQPATDTKSTGFNLSSSTSNGSTSFLWFRGSSGGVPLERHIRGYAKTVSGDKIILHHTSDHFHRRNSLSSSSSIHPFSGNPIFNSLLLHLDWNLLVGLCDNAGVHEEYELKRPCSFLVQPDDNLREFETTGSSPLTLAEVIENGGE